MTESYTLTVKKSLVRKGPGVHYPVAQAFPCGLPQGTVVGIDKVEGSWGHIVHTTWWISIRFAKR